MLLPEKTDFDAFLRQIKAGVAAVLAVLHAFGQEDYKVSSFDSMVFDHEVWKFARMPSRA